MPKASDWRPWWPFRDHDDPIDAEEFRGSRLCQGPGLDSGSLIHPEQARCSTRKAGVGLSGYSSAADHTFIMFALEKSKSCEH